MGTQLGREVFGDRRATVGAAMTIVPHYFLGTRLASFVAGAGVIT
jgi:hypothetical protein